GLLQTWMANGAITLAPHDVYFSIGETVGRPGALPPDAGLKWEYVPPCVALDWWPVHMAGAERRFTTVSNWNRFRRNSKRNAFAPSLDLPSQTTQTLELALGTIPHVDAVDLRGRGWRIANAHDVTATPWDYQRYIQSSLGEFSCAKPLYV